MLAFLFSTVAISLSGVMAPGPITAATLAAGAHRRHAGALIALGHAVVELPLVGLLAGGLGGLLDHSAVRAVIGLAGGGLLVLMGIQLLRGLRQAEQRHHAAVQRHPLVVGILLTAANPYFLVWWATVGLALASRAVAFGPAVLVLFALVHWLCDLVWLEVLSLAGFHGTALWGRRAQAIVSVACALVLLAFGGMFLYDGVPALLAQRLEVVEEIPGGGP